MSSDTEWVMGADPAPSDYVEWRVYDNVTGEVLVGGISNTEAQNILRALGRHPEQLFSADAV